MKPPEIMWGNSMIRIPRPRNTPLKFLRTFSKAHNARIYGKLELFNPTGSHKDRESWEVLRDMKNKGFDAVGCASTGNAAISLLLMLTCLT